MDTVVKLYSNTENEINKFLNDYFTEKNDCISINEHTLEWQKKYQNPVEIADIIGTYIENNYKFKLAMWVSFDKDIFIKITDDNADKIIRYLYERYPW